MNKFMLEIQQMNEMAVHLLNVQGYKGKVLEVFIEKVGQTQHLTKPFTQERIESLAKTNTHGARFTATGGLVGASSFDDMVIDLVAFYRIITG